MEQKEYWAGQAQRALHSVKMQSRQPEKVIISIADNLQEARNNEGLRATTSHIIFLDADDELQQRYIESMCKGTGHVRVPKVYRFSDNGACDTDQFWYTPRPLIQGNYIVVGAMIRADVFKLVGGFRDLPMLEDWDLWLRIEEKCCSFVQCPEAIYHIHVREGRNSQDQAVMIPKIIIEAENRRRKL
jgi:hypothetical protein